MTFFIPDTILYSEIDFDINIIIPTSFSLALAWYIFSPSLTHLYLYTQGYFLQDASSRILFFFIQSNNPWLCMGYI